MKEWIMAILPSIIVGVFMIYFERRQNKKDKEAEKKQNERDKEIKNLSRARKKESCLSLELQMSTAKLSYATAMAWKRGYPNGEVEDGIKDYEQAKKKYFNFMSEQATERLST